MFLKGNLFVLHPYIIFYFIFTILVTMAAPHSDFQPAFLLQLFQPSKVWFGTKAANIGDFGHLDVTFGH